MMATMDGCSGWRFFETDENRELAANFYRCPETGSDQAAIGWRGRGRGSSRRFIEAAPSLRRKSRMTEEHAINHKAVHIISSEVTRLVGSGGKHRSLRPHPASRRRPTAPAHEAPSPGPRPGPGQSPHPRQSPRWPPPRHPSGRRFHQ